MTRRRRDPEAPYWKAMDEASRQIIESALKASNGVVEHAATRLGISHNSLFVKIRELGIETDDFRPQ